MFHFGIRVVKCILVTVTPKQTQHTLVDDSDSVVYAQILVKMS